MPTLDWIGKAAVVNHHQEVPTKLLHCDSSLSVGDREAGNLLVEGDNLEALKALLPYYGRKVRCIYIDPPYNTGNEGWTYNDNVNSAEIRAWLDRVVGKEGEDFSRHDKWLCMMYPRLTLLKQFLSPDGAIFISIDDNEIGHARNLCDEIFGRSNFVTTIIWNMMDSPKNSAIHFSEDHEYILVYAANAKRWRPNPLPRKEEMNARYRNPDNDPRGPWLVGDLAARNFYAAGRYPITTPTGREIAGPPSGSYWRVSREKFDELDADSRIYWGKGGNSRPGIKRFLSEVKEGVVPQTLWPWRDVGSTRHSKQELSRVLNLGASSDLFVTPKPVSLISRIIGIATGPNDIVLDAFAGSGTTAHAVLALNKETRSNRRFVLVEMDGKIAKPITHKRLARVINGYSYSSNGKEPAEVEASGGGLRYCTLGKSLFDEWGCVAEGVTYGDLAAFIFFSDTGSPLPSRRDGGTSLLGTFAGRAIHLLWSAESAGAADERAGNVLTPDRLSELPKPSPDFDGPVTVYAEGCTVSGERLASAQVSFRQIPYQVTGA